MEKIRCNLFVKTSSQGKRYDEDAIITEREDDE